jgi:hypothetical protein
MNFRLAFSVALCTAAASAHAAVQIQFINRGTPVGPGGVLATGYTGYVVRLVQLEGLKITAVDMESGGNGLFGRFVQRWTSLEVDGNYETFSVNVASNAENLTPSVFNFDSHLLQLGNPKADANYQGKIGFTEDTGGAIFGPPGSQVSPFPANDNAAGYVVTGIDASIQAAFGIAEPARSSVIDLAYLVLPNDFYGNPSRPGLGLGPMLVAVEGGAPQVVLFPPIPEPATTAMLLSGPVALLRRMKK